MAANRGRRPSAPSASEMHRSWLELVDIEGPFLAIPPLKRVWPNGIPDFRGIHADRFTILASARKEFEAAWERVDRSPGDDRALEEYRDARDAWVAVVLRDVIGWRESLAWGEVPDVFAQSPSRVITVRAQAALRDPGGGLGALVHVIDPVDSLRQTPNDGWAATPIDRLEELLRAANVPVGIVTDGRWWGLVSARAGSMPASGIVDALTWVEEPRTRDAFLTILGRQYLVGGDPAERLPALFEESIAAAEEITEALGVQVRQAVELIIQAFSEASAEARRRGLHDPLPERSRDMYEAAVTIMMRTVFLLFAEERGLLPTGELFEQGYGMSGELARLATREAEEGEESLDATSMTWHRLLSTSNAIYAGATFESLRMPAYGGSLFDPARFACLTATTAEGTLAITVSDRVMLHVLRSVQLAVLRSGEARQISFRDIDVEQIGYIYEGLLGYTTIRVDEAYLGLKGASGAEPEIPLATLERLSAEHPDPARLAEAIRAWVEQDQPAAKAQSAAAIVRGLKADVDPSLVSALSQAVGGDAELRDRIRPWLGIIRQDLRSHPTIVAPGGLLLKETPSRRNAGAHYTPKSLAEEVVLHALQPLCYSPGPHQTGDESAWRLRPSEEILDLKVADIACGSGAFLVAAARYLADRVVEAWVAEDPQNRHRKDLHVRAIRQVVANCLYGADINDMAVEMAKLSLWLVSLDRDLPFSFVDDKVFLGNSLLGLTSLEQLRALHIDPSRAPKDQVLDIFNVDVDGIIRKAIDLRERLATEVDDDDPARSATAKRRQYAQLQDVTAELRRIADGVIAAGLPLGGKPGKALDEAYENLRQAIKQAQPEQAGGAGNDEHLRAIIDAGLTPTVETDYDRWKPLHWILEAPDVFVTNDGFNAIIGNPPFLGGQKLTGAQGTQIRDWLVQIIASGHRGSADLVAYFLLRAHELTSPTGTLGLIATNSIAQGVSREVGLDSLVEDDFTISRAVKSRKWPAASANLEFAAVWGTRGTVSDEAIHVCDGLVVGSISPLLESAGRVGGSPIRLLENRNLSFQGCIVLGDGFVLNDAERQLILDEDPHSVDVIFPFMNGEDVNGRPDVSASRWAIDFNDWSVEKAAEYPGAFTRVERLVKPERQRRNTEGAYVLRAPLPERWWHYAEKRPGLRVATISLSSLLVISRVSKYFMPVVVRSGQIFSDALNVFATESSSDLAVLSSSVHQIWAITHASTLRRDVRYTPSDVFETFPRPTSTTRLHELGATLHSERLAMMKSMNLGLTKLYNSVNDPEPPLALHAHVDRLRQIHEEIDRATLDAYGWSDIDPGHGFHEFRGMARWTVSPAARVEILDRLLEENHRRAALEAAADPVAKKGRGGKKAAVQEEALFT